MDKKAVLLIIIILALVGAGVYVNVRAQMAKDFSKIPSKVELSRNFQRWITNLKNNKVDVSADDFKMTEENEIYNSVWMKVYSMDDPEKKKLYDDTIANSQNIKKIVWSPSNREFIDYRFEVRAEYQPEDVRFFGQKEDKIIDARVVSCKKEANCYFDRAYFLDNDVFIISEISRNIKRDDPNTVACTVDSLCTYTIKLHVIDLTRNSRYVYESKPFDVVLLALIPEL